jgi:hypothetical protein
MISRPRSSTDHDGVVELFKNERSEHNVSWFQNLQISHLQPKPKERRERNKGKEERERERHTQRENNHKNKNKKKETTKLRVGEEEKQKKESENTQRLNMAREINTNFEANIDTDVNVMNTSKCKTYNHQI